MESATSGHGDAPAVTERVPAREPVIESLESQLTSSTTLQGMVTDSIPILGSSPIPTLISSEPGVQAGPSNWPPRVTGFDDVIGLLCMIIMLVMIMILCIGMKILICMTLDMLCDGSLVHFMLLYRRLLCQMCMIGLGHFAP